MVASLYCWEKRLFPLAYVEVEADSEQKIISIESRDSEWTLDYEMPPLKIMQIRLAGLSRIDPQHGRHAALEIEMDGRCWELDEQVNRHRKVLRDWSSVKTQSNSFRVGRFEILPLLQPASGAIEVLTQPKPRLRCPVQRSKPRSYTSYGRILFKASAITLFGRIHVDKQNSS